MAKRIAFCADGTWQEPRQNTNVYQLYKALKITADQVAYYDDGVGAGLSGIDRILAGAFGEGLLDKIKDGYTKIAHVYEKGDQVFLFGFSRGAYTARSLAGMIAACGLPTGSFSDSCVDKAFAAYRDRANRAAILAGLGACGLYDCGVEMIGVWDTVGSLGIPAIFGGVDEDKYGFLDTSLHPDVKNAYQCLAIDERRRQFPATLWQPSTVPGQVIEQVWFAGCHGEVGGGTTMGGGVDDLTTLSQMPMGWMVRKAAALGLQFDDATTALYQKMLPAKYALDMLHETWTLVAGAPSLRPIAHDAHIANSVGVRIEYALTYQPGNLKLGDDGKPAAGYTVVDIVDLNVI
jgi:uncharacterized protein (DUF2235 family)